MGLGLSRWSQKPRRMWRVQSADPAMQGGESLGQGKEKRCCSRLTDCKPGDAWPKEFEELQEVSKAKGQEFDQCFQSCKSRIPELCVADLQKTQEAFRQSLEKDIEALGPRPGDNDRKLLEWQKNYEELIGGKLHQEKLARLQRIYQQLE